MEDQWFLLVCVVQSPSRLSVAASLSMVAGCSKGTRSWIAMPFVQCMVAPNCDSGLWSQLS